MRRDDYCCADLVGNMRLFVEAILDLVLFRVAFEEFPFGAWHWCLIGWCC